MRERFEIYIVYKWHYTNTLPFLSLHADLCVVKALNYWYIQVNTGTDSARVYRNDKKLAWRQEHNCKVQIQVPSTTGISPIGSS